MPDTAKNVLKARTESHSDVANTEPARARQLQMTEQQLGTLLIARLREVKENSLQLSKFEEEWHSTDDGLVLELSVQVSEAEVA